MQNVRFAVLADHLAHLDPGEHDSIQRIRVELVELKLLLERVSQRELADFVGATDAMVRSIASLDPSSFHRVRGLAADLMNVVAEAVGALGGPASPPPPSLRPQHVDEVPPALRPKAATAEQPAQPSLPPNVEASLDTADKQRLQPSSSLKLSGEQSTGIRTMSELLLGQILIECEVIERPHLIEALKLQAQKGLRIGKALVKLGHLTDEQLETALQQQRQLAQDSAPDGAGQSLKQLHELTLGEILTRINAVSEEDVADAMNVQRATGKRLGEALVELGATTWERIQEAVKIQARNRENASSNRPHLRPGLSLRLAD